VLFQLTAYSYSWYFSQTRQFVIHVCYYLKAAAFFYSHLQTVMAVQKHGWLGEVVKYWINVVVCDRSIWQESVEDCNEELYGPYCSPNINLLINSRSRRWAGHVVRTGDRRGACRVFVGKRQGISSLRMPMRRWEDNFKVDLQRVWWGAWNGLSWLRIGRVDGLL